MTDAERAPYFLWGQAVDALRSIGVGCVVAGVLQAVIFAFADEIMVIIGGETVATITGGIGYGGASILVLGGMVLIAIGNINFRRVQQ